MADAGPPAPPPLFAPPVELPVPPIQPVVPPAQPNLTQPMQSAHVPQLNWSHFKPEFAGKPDEDAEAKLFRMKTG